MDEHRTGLLGSPRLSRIAKWGVVCWSLIGVAILAYFVYRVALYPIRVVVVPLAVAMVIVYLLNPIVSALEGRGVPRVWGTLLTYLVFLTIVGVALRFLVPMLASQVSSFASTLPRLLANAQSDLARTFDRLGADVQTTDFFRALSPEGGAGSFFSRIFSFTAGVLHSAVVFLLGLVLSFYLVVDLPKIQRGFMALVPPANHRELVSILERMGRALGAFFRGQLLVALFVGLASMLGLYIVGLPYWAVVGGVAGLFNLIPMIGPFIGAIPALFIAFTTTTSGGLLQLEPGWPLAIGASVALLIVQQIDNHIISPNVVARTVKLHPVTVMLGLLVGGTLLGLWGMLLAVPTIAAAKILVLHYWDTRMHWPPGGFPEVKAPARAPAEAASAAPERPIESPTEPVVPVRDDGPGVEPPEAEVADTEQQPTATIR
ncbi:MAG TPA: AI-2E family transporter [Actinomycetota bacterium]|nr:AI-2E family transporter [Actinomycetota bacterium]